MTGMVAITQRYQAFLFTDAAGYFADGTLDGFICKTATLPHLKAAMMIRGSAAATSLFAANLGGRFAEFDALISGGGAFIEELHDTLFHMLIDSGETHFDMTIVGFSESENCFKTYVLSSYGLGEYGEPFQFVHAPDLALVPSIPDEDLMAQNHDPYASAAKVDAVTEAIKIMEGQRLQRFPTIQGGDEEHHVVGGHILMTKLDRDGVHQKVVHRWEEDEIGKPIIPRLRQPTTNCKDGLSRQQRRALNRQQRKSLAEVGQG